MRLRRGKRAGPTRLTGELTETRDQIRSGALVAMVSYEVWDSLSLRDRGVLLSVDDCMSGRYDVAELRRRLYTEVPDFCEGCANEDAGGSQATGVAVNHTHGPGCRHEHPSVLARPS